MLVLRIILSIFGLGALLCLLFTLAIYALPFFVAVTAGMAAFHSGAGVIGAILVAAFVGGATLAIGQIVFATVRSPAIRATVALLYAIPATIAGYSAAHGLAELSMPSATWQMIFAIIGAICVGCTAFARLAMLAPPVLGQGFSVSPATPRPSHGTRVR
jgi:MFS family permease